MSHSTEHNWAIEALEAACPCCGKDGMREFYTFSKAPVHSVLLMPTKEEALQYPKGEVRLGFCEGCGFISNMAYDPAIQEYSARCEETQGFSETFNSFSQALAAELVERHSLRGKRIIEIGCGKGEFLSTLCELGESTGIGFDPAFAQGRLSTRADVSFITDFYSDKYADIKADFIVCKMTLEHIGETGEFLSNVRRSLEGSPDTVLFFQVPDVTRILRELAFWDIYYEHCSYFSPGSLARLFRSKGFEVTSIRKDYGGQYIILEARPAAGPGNSGLLPEETDIETIRGLVEYFTENIHHKIAMWQDRLREFERSGVKAVIWGSGSKGVAFLTTLAAAGISCAVDINPYRKGTFMAGTGHEIVSPEYLIEHKPDAVILMNPVYTSEVERELRRIGVSAEMLTV